MKKKLRILKKHKETPKFKILNNNNNNNNETKNQNEIQKLIIFIFQNSNLSNFLTKILINQYELLHYYYHPFHKFLFFI